MQKKKPDNWCAWVWCQEVRWARPAPSQGLSAISSHLLSPLEMLELIEEKTIASVFGWDDSSRLLWNEEETITCGCWCRSGPLRAVFLSLQLHPRSGRSSTRRCSSAASSSPGWSPSNPTASSKNMKSNTTKKYVRCLFIFSLSDFRLHFTKKKNTQVFILI